MPEETGRTITIPQHSCTVLTASARSTSPRTGSLSNRRVWAAGLGPNGICLDAEGVIWVGTADVRLASGRDDASRGAVARVREGGEVLQRIEHDREIFAAMLGGPDRQTLFLLAANGAVSSG
jgi:sugar lactone lactonase YvrE